jgi:hypothetical protein
VNDKRLVESALEKMLISRWIFAAHSQRFLFSTPKIICPEIEQLCANSSSQGLAKIAAVLDITAPYLDIRMEEGAKEMIKQIKS